MLAVLNLIVGDDGNLIVGDDGNLIVSDRRVDKRTKLAH